MILWGKGGNDDKNGKMDKDKGMRKRDDHEGQGRHHVSSEKPESTIKGLPGFSCSQSNDVITGRCFLMLDSHPVLPSSP